LPGLRNRTGEHVLEVFDVFGVLSGPTFLIEPHCASIQRQQAAATKVEYQRDG
jgi:hypothetical protein